MFNLFKDMYFEAQGYDLNAMKQERLEKEQEKKKETLVLNKVAKHIIRGAGILFLLIGTISVSTYFENGEWLNIAKYIFMITLDITAMVLVSIKKKDTEVAGIICSAVFVILNMILPMM